MAVSSVVTKSGPWLGDGKKLNFPYGFRVLDDAQLEVVLVDGVDSMTRTETLQTLNADYTVSGAGNASGGTIAMAVAPAVGQEVVIRRNVEPLQPTDLTGTVGWRPERHEAAFDRLAMIAQQLDEEIGRVVKVSLASGLNPDTLVSDAAQDAVDAETSKLAAEASALEAQGAEGTVRDPRVVQFSNGTGFTAGSSNSVDLDPVTPTAKEYVIVAFDGIAQHHSTYDVAGSVITFDSQIPNGVEEIEVIVNNPLAAGVPSDGAVTLAAFAPGAVRQSIIADVTREDATVSVTQPALTFRMPYAMTLVEVRASLSTASSSGAVSIDLNAGGVSVLSTPVSIDVNERTSKTAAIPPVIGTPALADDAEITVDIDAAGTGAAGLKVTLIGDRA